MTTAKALTSGYFPYSASFVSDEIWELIRQGSVEFGNFSHGYTYAGHPIGAAVAMANLQVRGRGMIAAVQLVKNKSTKTFFDKTIKIAPMVTQRCYQNGLIARPLPSIDSIAFSPPLVCTVDDVNEIVDLFEVSVRSVMAEVLQ